MTTYSYNVSVPNGPNDPADDQPFMLTNTASISGLISTNHVGFNTTNGGIHTVINFLNQTVDPVIDPMNPLPNLYTKTVGSDQQLFYESPAGVIEQITGGSSSGGVGYVLLPGGFIMQWGTFTNTTGTNPISFTPNFSAAPFWIGPVTVINNFGSRTFYHTYNQTTSSAVIQCANISGAADSGPFTVQWLAVGKA